MTFRGYLPVLSLIAGIIICLLFNLSLAFGLLAAVLVTLWSVRGLGFSYREQFAFGWGGFTQTKPVLMILGLVGLMIPILMMAGTIPAIIYYGLSIVNVHYLLILSFLLTAGVSYLLGTSVGTLSTIGLSLLGIAHAVQLPLPMIAGALISGAMVGERFSPLSSSRLLVLSSIGGDEQVTRFAKATGLLAMGITAVLFLALDLTRDSVSAAGVIGSFQQLMEQYFQISLLKLIPLLVLVGSFAFRVKAVPALFYGLVSGVVLLLFSHPPQIGEFFRSMLYGFDLNSQTKLDEMVHGGGMIAILKVLVVISLAGFMNGILNKANLLSPIINRLMGETGNPVVLVIKSVLLSLLVIIISCNQTIPILVLGATLPERFQRLAGGKQLLGRTMLDATLVMPPLVPWNGLAMVISVTLGVPTLQSLPYSLFLLFLPLITILFTRFAQPKRMEASQRQVNHAG
ncbi:sodium:proton antiporter [Brevibacillus fluminis]|uniref:Sodium:proton antiporter n=1 Tax=Brevibacillus fluminis TaxID=511487 RepID=A0A3M8DJR3_9BACL|nr:Na+/H+ antiporter NhaC family protein [Brevibacillus fluminis]RNB87625.1 sodium:proton antiporter [Brevibacillus fluminis]